MPIYKKNMTAEDHQEAGEKIKQAIQILSELEMSECFAKSTPQMRTYEKVIRSLGNFRSEMDNSIPRYMCERYDNANTWYYGATNKEENSEEPI